MSPILTMRPPAAKPQRRWTTGVMAAAAALLVAIPAASIVIRQNDRINDINDGVAQQANLERVALAASADPLARKARLRSVDGTQTASAVVLPDGRGYLIRNDLAPLEEGRVYQLWGMPDGTAKPISLGVLGSSPRVVAFSADTPFTALAISVERPGGSVAPTSRPLVVGELVGRA
ncbi:MAG TPA: anti-sigma factor [Acidimicrobiales bacterium]|nr:anti-sigma factor [Acidimicrobiales bacterium]